MVFRSSGVPATIIKIHKYIGNYLKNTNERDTRKRMNIKREG